MNYRLNLEKMQRSFENYIESRGNPLVMMRVPSPEFERLAHEETAWLSSFPSLSIPPHRAAYGVSVLMAKADEADLEYDFYNCLQHHWSLSKLYMAAEDDTSRFHSARNAFAIESLEIVKVAGVPIDPFVSDQLQRVRQLG